MITGLRDARTSEIGTYVTPKQIASLPQITRNFLSFADIAPGVVVESQGSQRKLRSGTQPAAGVNVFIDGIGQKDYVLRGGITGIPFARAGERVDVHCPVIARLRIAREDGLICLEVGAQRLELSLGPWAAKLVFDHALLVELSLHFPTAS